MKFRYQDIESFLIEWVCLQMPAKALLNLSMHGARLCGVAQGPLFLLSWVSVGWSESVNIILDHVHTAWSVCSFFFYYCFLFHNI